MSVNKHFNDCVSQIKSLENAIPKLSGKEKREASLLLSKLNKIKEDLIKISARRDHIDFGDYTLQEIADRFGITRERVRQIELNAIKKIKHPKVGRRLKDYIHGISDIPSNPF